MKATTKQQLAGAFREAVLALMGVFELHDAEPELVEDAGEALARVYQARLAEREGTAVPAGRSAMTELLEALEEMAA